MRWVTSWEKHLNLLKGPIAYQSMHLKYQDPSPFRVIEMTGKGGGITDVITMVLLGAFTALHVLQLVFYINEYNSSK